MAKVRIFELAREMGVLSKDLIDRAQAAGIEVKNHMTALEPDHVETLRKLDSGSAQPEPAPQPQTITTEDKEGQTVQVVQKRLGKTIIRRRAKSVPPPSRPQPRPAGAAAEPPAEPEPKPVEVEEAPIAPPVVEEAASAPQVETAHEAPPTETPPEPQPEPPVEEAPVEKKVETAQPLSLDRIGPVVRTPRTVPSSGEIRIPKKPKPVKRPEPQPKPAEPATPTEPSAKKGRPGAPGVRVGDDGRSGPKSKKGSKKTRIVFNDRRRKRDTAAPKKTAITIPKASKRVIKIPGSITVMELSQKMGIKAGELLKKLLLLDIPSTINQAIDIDVASVLAEEYGYRVESAAFEVSKVIEEDAPDDKPEDLVPRSPVVTVMGHVDHGKTSLLDKIRSTDVAAGEAGKITQHIGAYKVDTGDQQIVFLDTPGHEAFTAMRARGAGVTDIVVLVVSAVDSVQPQTVESIGHARAAGIPIIVAVNKMDLPGASVDRVKQDLIQHEVLGEEVGGDIMFFPISAKTGDGVKELLEGILLQAEVLELKANPTKAVKGAVVEAHLDKGRGPMATVLIQQGTMKKGEIIISGLHYGRVKRMLDDRGQDVTTAGPATPVQVLGLQGLPEAGDEMNVVKNERQAKQVIDHRTSEQRQHDLNQVKKVSLERFQEHMSEGEVKELLAVVKADVQGSLEAIQGSLAKLTSVEARVKVIHGGVGGINQSDVLLAGISNAIVLGFNVRPDSVAKQTADAQGVEIRTYSVIYDIVDDITRAMEGMLDPIVRESIIGHAEVKEVFHIAKVGPIAGCYLADGKIRIGSKARVVRDQTVIHTGEIGSLRRFQDSVKEVTSGLEFGCALKSYKDIRAGDVLELFSEEMIDATLTPLEPKEA